MMKPEILERHNSRSSVHATVRQNRERYDVARSLLERRLTAAEGHTDVGFYRALNELQNTYPELSAGEIEALVSAVMRSLTTRSVSS